VPEGLPRVLRHQSFEFAFGPFVVEKGLPGVAKERGELRPGIRRAHIDDTDSLNARPRGLGIDQAGRFARLHAAPELLFRRHQNAEPPPVMIDRTEVLKWVTHMLCCTWAMYFSAAVSSENDQGSMNLDSKTAPVASTVPSRVAAIQGMAECLTRRWTSVTCRPVLRSYQERLSSSVAAPICTMRLPDKSSGSASPRFSPKSDQSCFIAPHDDPGIRAADEGAAPCKLANPQCIGCLELPSKSLASSFIDENGGGRGVRQRKRARPRGQRSG
jgi:hypothetical protein